MNSAQYVWEKLFVAIDCMCGRGSFLKRLENATLSSLLRLDESDLSGALGDDLAYILGWTKDNMGPGGLQKLPDEPEQQALIDKMLHVMLETYRSK